VQQDAEVIEPTDLESSREMKARARRLYLRARNYGLRALEANHHGITNRLRSDPLAALKPTTKKDVPILYWTAMSWAAAISLSKDDPDLIADLPVVEALVDRCLDLDEAYDHGAIHSFLITYEMARQGVPGDPAERARKHFKRAVELSDGQLAGPYVSLAEAVAVQTQNRKEFEELLTAALAINPDGRPEWRLVNMVMQRRARWLQGRQDELFLVTEQR
jgi:predicted anti-sigma-YlaC factor YlaD